MHERALVVVGIAALALALACGNGDAGSETAARSTAGTCAGSLPFKATHVPPGFEAQARPGVGGGAAPPPGQTAFVLRGPYDESVKEYPKFIEVFRGEGRSPLDAQASSVTVLGATGKIGEIHEGYGVSFDVPSEPVGCRHFTLEAYGVSVDELRRFAEGLEPAY